MKNPFGRTKPPTLPTSPEEIVRLMCHPTTSKESFFLLYSRLVELRCHPRTVQYEEPGLLHLSEVDGSGHVLYLENLWIQCREDQAAAPDIIERFLSVAENLGNEPELQREQIIPWVKDQEYVDQFLVNSTAAREHLAADLWIVYAAHVDGSSYSINDSEIADLGIARDSLRELSTDNLRRILPPIEMHDFETWLLLSAGADYVPSLLLLDEVWDQLASQVSGDIVVAAPVADSVFVAGTSSPEGLVHIRKRAIALEAEGDHVVSSTLLRRIPGGWKAFD